MDASAVSQEVERIVATIRLPAVMSSFDLRSFYAKIWSVGGYASITGANSAKGTFEKLISECGGVPSSAKKLRKVYEANFCSLDVRRIASAFIASDKERTSALEAMVALMDFWLDYEGASAKRFDVVEELWRALGENAEKLVGMLAGILQAANDEKQKEDSLRMMQELSYEHEDFARVLVKPHNAKVLVKMAHSGQERVQALACKTLQNVSWWKDHAKPLIDVGTLTVLSKLLDTEGVNARIKTAAASALANITDHDVRHCQALLNIKKMEFWLQLLASGSPPLTGAALHLIESLAKNVQNIRSKAIPQLQGVEAICRVLTETDQDEVASAAIDCLEEVCRGVNSNLSVALSVLQASSLQEALRRKEASLQHASSGVQARKRARAAGRGDEHMEENVVGASAGKRNKQEDEAGQNPVAVAAVAVAAQVENANPLLPMLNVQNLKEVNVSERDAARVTGGRAGVPSNAVLELLVASMKEQRLALESARASSSTLEAALRAALVAAAAAVRSGASAAQVADALSSAVTGKLFDASSLRAELDDVAAAIVSANTNNPAINTKKK